MNIILVSFLAFQYIITNTIQGDLTEVKKKTDIASRQLMLNAHAALQSDTIKHMVRIQELLEELHAIDGTLVKYEVKGKSAGRWEALVPQAFDQKQIGGSRIEAVGIEADKRVRVRGKG